MKITLMDRSLYFKGLLLLVRKDGLIHEEERDLMMRVGGAFGYEKQFCGDTIQNALVNRYIEDSPPVFSDPEIAKRFIIDGIRLSLSDRLVHEREWGWIKAVAERNGIDPVWFSNAFETAGKTTSETGGKDLEAFNLEWD
jgi:hypothetical protein